MKVIQREELEKYLDFLDVYNKSIDGFIKFSHGKTITPPFTVFEIPENNGSVHFKYGYVEGSKTFSFKYSGAFYENEKKGISNFLGLFVVFNSDTGEVELIIDDKGYLTDYRTGVAGAIATKTLSRADSSVVAVIGTGIQARMQIISLMKVMPQITTLNVYGRNLDNAKKYKEDMEKLYPNLIINLFDNPKEAVEEADIIYTVTYSNKAILMNDWIKKGTHITAVGACGPDMQELDESIIINADLVVVDSISATLTHGELHHAKEKGFNTTGVKELGDILKNNISRNENDITVCDLVGIGVQDAVIGDCVYNKVLKL